MAFEDFIIHIGIYGRVFEFFEFWIKSNNENCFVLMRKVSWNMVNLDSFKLMKKKSIFRKIHNSSDPCYLVSYHDILLIISFRWRESQINLQPNTLYTEQNNFEENTVIMNIIIFVNKKLHSWTCVNSICCFRNFDEFHHR